MKIVRRLLGRDPETVPELSPGSCEHLAEFLAVAGAGAAAGERACEPCLREGTQPVHLRQCLSCGTVGCCDSGGRHATTHFRATGHPVMRSIEPGESWRWCYVHEQLG